MIAFMLASFALGACSNKLVIPADRLTTYLDSGNECFEAIFSNEHVIEGVQPVLTKTEINILDALAARIGKDICREFDYKCLCWMSCWAHLDPATLMSNPQYALRCNEAEYRDLIDFCKQQDEQILLLFYQLAARASCPYDQFLLRPIIDLSESFPEYEQFRKNINRALINEKPDLDDRKCNETTIWYTRKILETKYGYTYASRLSSLFDSRKLLLMTP
jgi:hypothetical protein